MEGREGLQTGNQPALMLQGLGRDLWHVLGERRGGRGDHVRGAGPGWRSQGGQQWRIQNLRTIQPKWPTGGRQSLEKKREDR